MKFILGQKGEMTQKFAQTGSVIPVTKVVTGLCMVTQIKTEKNDGYCAIQVGFGQKNKINKPLKGHLKDSGQFRYLKEFRITTEESKNLKVGDKITVNIFQPGDLVKVTGASKGKGFQGVVRRHGFHGSPASHGHKDQLRMPGSIGATGPAHVFKGTKMGGQMGGQQVTVTNLEVVDVDADKQELFVKGAIPGKRGGLVFISGPGEFKVEELKETKEETKEEKSASAKASAGEKASVDKYKKEKSKKEKLEEKND